MKETTYEQKASSETMIRFQDCDPLGHMNKLLFRRLPIMKLMPGSGISSGNLQK